MIILILMLMEKIKPKLPEGIKFISKIYNKILYLNLSWYSLNG